VLTEVTSVSEDCDFLSSAKSICKHSCVLLFPARSNVALLLRRPQSEEISRQWHCVQEISRSCDSWLVSRNDGLETGFSCL